MQLAGLGTSAVGWLCESHVERFNRSARSQKYIPSPITLKWWKIFQWEEELGPVSFGDLGQMWKARELVRILEIKGFAVRSWAGFEWFQSVLKKYCGKWIVAVFNMRSRIWFYLEKKKHCGKIANQKSEQKIRRSPPKELESFQKSSRRKPSCCQTSARAKGVLYEVGLLHNWSGGGVAPQM